MRTDVMDANEQGHKKQEEAKGGFFFPPSTHSCHESFLKRSWVVSAGAQSPDEITLLFFLL